MEKPISNLLVILLCAQKIFVFSMSNRIDSNFVLYAFYKHAIFKLLSKV
jgi:hypothetical protein